MFCPFLFHFVRYCNSIFSYKYTNVNLAIGLFFRNEVVVVVEVEAEAEAEAEAEVEVEAEAEAVTVQKVFSIPFASMCLFFLAHLSR